MKMVLFDSRTYLTLQKKETFPLKEFLQYTFTEEVLNGKLQFSCRLST